MIRKMLAMYHAYRMDETGATAIEYGLIAGGISLAIVAATFAFGDDLRTLFETMATKMQAANTNVQ